MNSRSTNAILLVFIFFPGGLLWPQALTLFERLLLMSWSPEQPWTTSRDYAGCPHLKEEGVHEGIKVRYSLDIALFERGWKQYIQTQLIICPQTLWPKGAYRDLRWDWASMLRICFVWRGTLPVDIVPFGHKICCQIANLGINLVLNWPLFCANPGVFKGTFEWYIRNPHARPKLRIWVSI